MVLLLDNFDSFTYNLVDYFHQLGVTCQLFRNNIPLPEIAQYTYRGVVLSPGPGVPAGAGNLLEVIHHYHSTLPLLGICLGHQALGTYFGATLDKAKVPMHGKISEIQTSPDPLFEGLPERIKVTRYHSLTLGHLPPALSVIAKTGQGEVMAIRHRSFPVCGLQFHPEAIMTDFGLSMLRNWVTFNNIRE